MTTQPKKPDPPMTPDGVKQLRLERRYLEERMRLRSIERSAKLMESSFTVPDWVGDYVDLLDRYRDGNTLLTPISTVNDRRYGRNFPMFQTEQELNLLRGPARILCATNAYAIGLMGGLSAYVVGTGYSYRCVPKGKADVSDELLAKCQDVIDEFMAREDVLWPELEAELFWRSREDGEYFLRHGLGDDGLTWVRTVEPEQVLQPPGSNQREWSFGILTGPEDAWGSQAYFICYMENAGAGEEVSPEDIVHAKVNTKRSIKRGLTDFCFSTYDALERADKLRRNLVEGAAVQAAFAGIRQHEAASLAQVQTFQQAAVDYSRTDQVTGRTTDYKKIQPGTIYDVPKGQAWVDPPGAHNAEAHIAVLAASLRGAGVRWNAPEWLSSTESSSNFASSLTAESPFVKRVELAQQYYGRRFKQTMRIVLGHAVQAGRLPAEALERVDVQVEAKSAEARNRLEEAQANQIRVGGRWKSPQTVAQEEGLDWQQEQQNWEEFEQAMGPAADALPLPGDNGDGRPPEANGADPGAGHDPSPTERSRYGAQEAAEAFDASAHPRGQPGNAGQFGSGGGGGGGGKPEPPAAYGPHVEKEAYALGHAVATHPPLAAARDFAKDAHKLILGPGQMKEKQAQFKTGLKEGMAKVRDALAPAADAAVADLSRESGKPPEKFGKIKQLPAAFAQALTAKKAQDWRENANYVADGLAHDDLAYARVHADALKLTLNDVTDAYHDALDGLGLLYGEEGDPRHKLRDVLDRHFLGHVQSPDLRAANTMDFDPEVIRAHGEPHASSKVGRLFIHEGRSNGHQQRGVK